MSAILILLKLEEKSVTCFTFWNLGGNSVALKSDVIRCSINAKILVQTKPLCSLIIPHLLVKRRPRLTTTYEVVKYQRALPQISASPRISAATETLRV